MQFKDKIVLVTGASRGIGQAIAKAFGEQGATVVGTATSDQGAAKISDYFQAEKIQGKGYKLNVCELESIEEVVGSIGDEFGAPNILINNAGITRDNILLRMKQAQWEEVIDTNLSGVFKVTKACLRTMLKARWGRIINISSVVGVSGNPGQANYTAAKAGVIGFTKSLAQEMAAYGLTANVVAPGFTDTDMTQALTDKQRETVMQMIPMRRIAGPAEIAGAVTFLASDMAAYITGQTLHVNGGRYMV
ncbi:MAG: 3-oxoacyl-ACP reductase FabG [Gammaproteobacteria bacterium]|nr:3-oxoacyl-ACP reductase FabG [Gammaproteobacteria bacterium]